MVEVGKVEMNITVEPCGGDKRDASLYSSRVDRIEEHSMKKPIYSLSAALVVLCLGMFNGAVNASSSSDSEKGVMTYITK